VNDAAAAAAPAALCLGGLDPSGGAGILRDVMTLAALGVHPMAVEAAATIQNGEACLAIHAPGDPLPALEALAPHLGGTWGVKVGLCALPPSALAPVAAFLDRHRPAARIWDPVQAPTSGVGLHGPEGLRGIARALLGSGGWVVAPNRPEAAALSGLAPESDPAALARPLLEAGAEAVWLKGGHAGGGEVEDLWITLAGVRGLGKSPRLPGDVRGTGCALASAWLALRLQGRPPVEAAREAATWLRGAWPRAIRPGGFGRPCFAPAGGLP